MNSIFLDLASATKIDLQRHWIEAKRIYPCTGKFKLICILQVLKWVGLLYGMSGLGWSRTQHAPLCEELKLPMFLKFYQVLPCLYTNSVRGACEVLRLGYTTITQVQLPAFYHLL